MNEINILIPVINNNSFNNDGILVPKSLVTLGNNSLIKIVVDNLGIVGKYIFIIEIERNNEKKQKNYLMSIIPDCIIIETNYILLDYVSVCLLAKKYIDNNNKLIIANYDVIVEWDNIRFINFIRNPSLDGSFVVQSKITDMFKSSSNLLIGIYYWKHGKYFVKSACKVNSNDNNIADTFNYLINNYKNIKCYNLGKNEMFYNIRTPGDYFKYVNKCLKNFDD